MSTNIAIAEKTTSSLVKADDVYGTFGVFADAVAPKHIQGKLLKFNKGDFLAGETSEIIPVGTKVIVGIDRLLSGWVYWQGGKPVDHRMVYVASGQAPPRRAELGDQDRALWEKDANGEIRDPWALTFYLPMIDETGEVFTFSTTSRGGINAVADLARYYNRAGRAHADKFPVVSLEAGVYQHSNPQYGRIKFPDFKRVGWESKSTFWRAVGEDEMVVAELAAEAKAADYSDETEIPF